MLLLNYHRVISLGWTRAARYADLEPRAGARPRLHTYESENAAHKHPGAIHKHYADNESSEHTAGARSECGVAAGEYDNHACYDAAQQHQRRRQAQQGELDDAVQQHVYVAHLARRIEAGAARHERLCAHVAAGGAGTTGAASAAASAVRSERRALIGTCT